MISIQNLKPLVSVTSLINENRMLRKTMLNRTTILGVVAIATLILSIHTFYTNHKNREQDAKLRK